MEAKPASPQQKKYLKDLSAEKKHGSILNGKDFDKLSSKEASDLIKRCKKKQREEKESKTKKNSYNNSEPTELTDEEEAQVREEHREHCKKIMQECLNDWRPDKEVAVAVFKKRADKIFTRLQKAKAQKQMQS